MGVQYTMQATEYHGFSCQFRSFRFSSSYTCSFFFFLFIYFIAFLSTTCFPISLPLFLSLSLSHSLFLAFSLNTHRTAHTRNALREITAIKIRRETKRDRWLSKILMELQWKDRNLSQGPVTRRYDPDPRPDYRAIVSFSNFLVYLRILSVSFRDFLIQRIFSGSSRRGSDIFT